jgi:acyl-CoA synthetase (AMP-forming)/AMP-acid ligase II
MSARLMLQNFIHPEMADDVVAILGPNQESPFTYGMLRDQSSFLYQIPRTLIFVFGRNSPTIAAWTVQALAANHVVALINPDLPSGQIESLLAAYEPQYVICPCNETLDAWPNRSQANGCGIFQRMQHAIHGLADGLSLLLSTSGTTGNAKMVRLSKSAVLANIGQIGQALHVTPAERAHGHLPLHYSFGLSVLTSHIAFGGSIVICDEPMTSKFFWEAVRQFECTSISGVPTHFDLMRRLGFERLRIPSVKTFCQAGGRASMALLEALRDEASRRNGRLYVMYGQTEAGPRMSTLPSEWVDQKLGSVGLALPGARFEIKPLNELDDVCSDGSGEVLYFGPNVMWGYAENKLDLSKGDEVGGHLVTGDIGRLDEDQCLWITGRVARMAKVHGLRIALDEIEAKAARFGRCAAVELNDKIGVMFQQDTVASELQLGQELAKQVSDLIQGLGTLPAGSVIVGVCEWLSVKGSGKLDYAEIRKQMLGETR